MIPGYFYEKSDSWYLKISRIRKNWPELFNANSKINIHPKISTSSEEILKVQIQVNHFEKFFCLEHSFDCISTTNFSNEKYLSTFISKNVTIIKCNKLSIGSLLLVLSPYYLLKVFLVLTKSCPKFFS